MPSAADIIYQLRQVPDPIGLLEGLFAAAPVAFQIYKADGHPLIANDAFRKLFGSEPPPEYNVLKDEIAAANGVLGLIQRAFAGETVEVPPVWYDPRQLSQVKVTEANRVAISTTFFPIRDSLDRVSHVGLVFRDLTAELLAREASEHRQREAEENQRKLRFLARASATLGESLDYTVTLRKVAQLAVPAIADWSTVVVADAEGVQRRIAVFHRDPDKAELVRAYERNFPPTDHRAGHHGQVLQEGKPVLLEVVDPELLGRSAQDPEHLRIMRELGVRSCLMVPLLAQGRVAGAISLMLATDERRFTPDDLLLAEELAGRAALAMENSRLFREEQKARAQAEASRRRVSMLDALTRALVNDLGREAGVEELARLLVPALADWCLIYLVTPAGQIEMAALAHQDPVRETAARELLHDVPLDPTLSWGVPGVIRTGQSELLTDVSDARLEGAGASAEHLAALRNSGISSHLAVALKAHGKVFGCLALSQTGSGRTFTEEDLPLVEELGVRAALVLEQARLYREAQDAIRTRDEFLSIASHELNTPLTSLDLSVNSLRRALEFGRVDALVPSKLGERLAVVARQTVRLRTLIHQLLDVSRVSGKGLTLERAPVDLSALAREVASHFLEEAERTSISLTVDAPQPVVGEWDRDRLDQVVTNLVSNAFKYGAGQPIEVRVRGSDTGAQLEVVDHGMGIAPENQARIFGRFERAVSARNFGGLGLGLWIVRQIVETHGGTISVRSATGEGATFIVVLPLRAGTPARLD